MCVLEWIEGHPGLAAWVQAIGTIAAVAFAVWLPMRDRRSAEKTAEVAARTPIMAAMVATTEAWNFLRSGSASFETKQKIAANLSAAHERLNGFALHTLSARAAVSFQEVRDAYHMAVNGFSDPDMYALGNMYLRGEFLERVQKLLEHAPGVLDANTAAGLARAIRETKAETAAREAKGEKPDGHG